MDNPDYKEINMDERMGRILTSVCAGPFPDATKKQVLSYNMEDQKVNHLRKHFVRACVKAVPPFEIREIARVLRRSDHWVRQIASVPVPSCQSS